MGGSTSRNLQPQDLTDFKKLSQYSNLYEDINIPESPENRRPTDRKFIIVFLVVVAAFIPFMIYSLAYSDIDRLYGYDQCGNVCGKKNYKYPQWECSGKDFTDEKYLQILKTDVYDDTIDTAHDKELLRVRRSCVSKCDFGYTQVMDYCLQSTFSDTDYKYENKVFLEISLYLKSVGWKLTCACFLSLALPIFVLILFRTATVAMVWSIMAGVATLVLIFVGFLWYLYFTAPVRNGFALVPALFTCLFLGVVALIIFLRRKIALVIILLKEAMKATFDMPRLILIPLISFFTELIVAGLLFTVLVYLSTSGVLTELSEDLLYYRETIVMSFTSLFALWLLYWISQFITAIQYMTIAGAVSKWYFSKNKNSLDSPILTSAFVTFKYHLGTAAFGSMVITIIAIVRSILSTVLKSKLAEVCCRCIEDFLAYLTKNAYIITAMHGKPFYKSGQRAAQIIIQNVVKVAVLTNISSFVIFMAHVISILLSLLVTYSIMQSAESSPHEWCVYVIVAIVALLVSAICFSVIETVIDTVFLCFCEDNLLNDGMSRPYAMSRDLMEFVDKSKKMLGEKK